ncbi:hypothetical protein V5F40_06730 [Xanthobacter sp. DSM 14520]|uniref:hypothetical protein n=1 Tax=Xanthobacter autotrophicus (strain ATCC BAA-1158 / Py2) TaxID=78245 RepID=UPI00372A0F90
MAEIFSLIIGFIEKSWRLGLSLIFVSALTIAADQFNFPTAGALKDWIIYSDILGIVGTSIVLASIVASVCDVIRSLIYKFIDYRNNSKKDKLLDETAIGYLRNFTIFELVGLKNIIDTYGKNPLIVNEYSLSFILVERTILVIINSNGSEHLCRVRKSIIKEMKWIKSSIENYDGEIPYVNVTSFTRQEA